MGKGVRPGWEGKRKAWEKALARGLKGKKKEEKEKNCRLLADG